MRVWPFEGRGDELAAITSAFENLTVTAVVLRGTAGVGKTRLAHQAVRELPSRHGDWIVATRSGGAIPFGALAHLLPEPSDTSPVGAMSAITTQVKTWGGRAHVVLGVDDAHLLDDASAATIAHLANRAAAFVVATVRAGEPLPDAVIRLCRDDHTQVMSVEPLPDEAVDRLIDHSTDGAVSVLERRRLREGAKGNPLALRELLHGAVPGGLTDLVTARLVALPAPIRAVVELVACGEPLPLAIVERLADPAAIGAAEDSGLVVAEADGRRVQTWLAHPLYGDVLRARMRLARSRQLYGSLAAELLGTALNRRDDMLRAAVWQVDSGTITRPDVVREGARLAIGRASLDLAERLARAARAARPDPETDRLLAEILEYQGRSSEAAAILPVEPPADLVGRIKWAVTSSESSYWGDGDVVAAHAALDTVAGQPQVEASRSWILFFDGQCAQAVRTARTVLAGPDADPLAVVWASAAGIAAHGFLGDLDEARAMHRRAIPVARQHAADLPWAVFEIDVGACLAHLACGELRLAESIATAGYDTAVDANVPMMVAGWALYRGLVAVHRGHLADAEALLTEALAGFETSDTFRLSRCCLAALAWTCALRDDHAAARQWMARADRLTTGANRLFTPWLTLWRGWVARSAGAVGEATQLAAESADLARAGAMTTAEAVARYDQIRVGAPPGGWPLDRLATLPGAVPALLTTAARALAGHDDVALAGVADDLTAKGHDLLAAEVATIAARGLRKRGHDLAGVVAEKAAVLRGRCGDACTPLLTTPDLTTVLTPREREVLLMAAEHTSKQIAQRLGLAVPTVNNTLARAYTKLGIAGRAELRPLLRNARG